MEQSCTPGWPLSLPQAFSLHLANAFTLSLLDVQEKIWSMRVWIEIRVSSKTSFGAWATISYFAWAGAQLD